MCTCCCTHCQWLDCDYLSNGRECNNKLFAETRITFCLSLPRGRQNRHYDWSPTQYLPQELFTAVLFSCSLFQMSHWKIQDDFKNRERERGGWKPERWKHEEERKGFNRKSTCFLFSQFSWIWSDHHCIVFSAARHMHLPHVIIYFGVRGKAATDGQTDMCFSSPSRNARWNLSPPLVQTLQLKSSSLHKRTEGFWDPFQQCCLQRLHQYLSIVGFISLGGFMLCFNWTLRYTEALILENKEGGTHMQTRGINL